MGAFLVNNAIKGTKTKKLQDEHDRVFEETITYILGLRYTLLGII